MEELADIRHILVSEGISWNRSFVVAKQIQKLYEGYVPVEDVVSKLDKCFELAPNDDSYLRILAREYLEYLKTGETASERAHKNYLKHHKTPKMPVG